MEHRRLRKSIAATAIIALGGCSYLGMQPMRTVKSVEGNIGLFAIGETKAQILYRLPEATFSPRPKPAECPRNWLKVAYLTEVERICLLSADKWVEGTSSTRSLCPKNMDVNTELHFNAERLSEVVTECWRPK